MREKIRPGGRFVNSRVDRGIGSWTGPGIRSGTDPIRGGARTLHVCLRWLGAPQERLGSQDRLPIMCRRLLCS